jgi:hypothetical protein
MANRSSLWTHRILLLLGALSALGALYWAGQKFFEPVPITLLPPPRTRVEFNPKSDITKNELFQNLVGFVTGDVRPTTIGRDIPFVAGEQAAKAPPQISRLLDAALVDIGTATAEAVGQGVGGRIVALMKTYDPVERKNVYEIRSFQDDGTFESFTTWSEDAVTVLGITHLTQDVQGTVWLATSGGRVAGVKKGQAPFWLDPGSVLLETASQALVADGSGRVWVTDGESLWTGGDLGYTRIDLVGYLSAEELGGFDALAAGLPPDIRPAPSATPPNHARGALAPDGLWALADGGMSVSTGYAAVRFGPVQATPPSWTNTLADSTLPFLVSPNGDIWSIRYTDGAIVRTNATGSAPVEGLGALVTAMGKNPLRLTGAGRSFVVSYDAALTEVWTIFGDSWIVQYASSSGALPAGPAREGAVDASGSLWVLTESGSLVRFSNPPPG